MRRALTGLVAMVVLTQFCGRAEAVFFSNVRLESTVLETAVNVYSNPVITTIVGRTVMFDVDLYQTVSPSTTISYTYTKTSGTLTTLGTGVSTVIYPTAGGDQSVVRNELPAPGVAGTWNGTVRVDITSAVGNDYRFNPLDATDSNDLAGEPNGNLSNSRIFPFQLRVLDQSNPSLDPISTVTSQLVGLGTVITGAPVQTSPFSVNNLAGPGGASLTVGLNLTGNSTSGDTAALSTDLSTPAGPIAAGTGTTYNAQLNSGSIGVFSEVLTVNTQNAVTLPSVSDNRPNLQVTLQGTVIDHSEGSFANASNVDSQNINFGTVITGASVASQNFGVSNLPSSFGAPLTADLDLDTVNTVGSGAITTTAAPFSNLAAGSTNNFTASLNTSGVGNYSTTQTLGVSDENLPGATTGTSLTLNMSADVLDHSEASFSGSDVDVENINLGTVITGAPTQSQGFSINNLASSFGAALTAGLDLDAISSSGSSAISTNVSTFTNLAGGSGNSYNAQMTTGSVGSFSRTEVYDVSDQNLPGATAGNSLTLNVTGAVLDHSEGSFSGVSDVDTQNLNLGPVIAGAVVNQAFAVHNLSGSNGPALTAGLDLDLVSTSGSPELTTDAATFSGLGAGNSNSFNAMVNTAVPGSYAATQTYAVSDVDLPGATSGNTLTLNLSADVLAPSQGSFSTPTDTDTQSINLGTVITGAATQTQNFSIHNLSSIYGPALTAGLDLDSISTSGSSALSTDVATFNNLAAGTANSYTAQMVTSSVGNFSRTEDYGVSDQNLPGATAGATMQLTITGTVLDHSEASFSGASDVDTETINFGSVIAGAVLNQAFAIHNRPGPNGAALTVGLDLDLVNTSGSPELTTDVATFSGLAAGGSNSYTASVNTAVPGSYATTQTYDVSDVNLPGATSGTSLTVNLSANVLSPSQGSFSTPTDTDVESINLGTVITGAPTQSQSFAIHNLPSIFGPALTAGLDLDSIASVGSSALSTDVSTFNNLAAGTANPYTAQMVTSSVGNFSRTETYGVSDENLPGATAGANMQLTVTGTVLDHSEASLSGASDVDAENINLGTVIVGATVNQAFAIHNRPGPNGAALTAGLDLDSVMTAGSPALSTNVATFNNLAAGTSNSYNATVNTTSAGNYSSTETYTVSDVNIPGATAGNNLTVNLSADVLDHSEGSFSGASNVDTQTINFGTVLVGAAAPTQAFSVHNLASVNGAALTAGLDIDTVSSVGSPQLSTNVSPLSSLAAATAAGFLASMNTSTAGVFATTETLGVSDEDLPGATAGTNLDLSMTGTVLAHAIPSLNGVNSSNLTVIIGTFLQGSGTQTLPLSVFNLVNVPLLTAALDLDTIVPNFGNSPEITLSGLSPFSNLAAGTSLGFSGLLDTSVVGLFSSTWVLNFSDEDLPGEAFESITLTITGRVLPNVIVPEPGSVIVWTLLGACVAGAHWRRRRSKLAVAK